MARHEGERTRAPRRLAASVIVLCCLLIGPTSGSAAGLGGLTVETLGGQTATVRGSTGLTLGYAPRDVRGAWVLDTLSVAADSGQRFAAGTRIRFMVTQQDGSRCQAGVTIAAPTAIAVVPGGGFGCTPSTPLIVDHMRTVMVALTDPHGTTIRDQGNLGGLTGTLTTFTRQVNSNHMMQADFTAGTSGGVPIYQEARISVATGVTRAALTGAQVRLSVTGSQGATFNVGGTVSGNLADPVHLDPQAAVPTIIVNLADRRLGVDRAATYRLILTMPQHLGQGASPVTYAVDTAGGALSANLAPSTALQAVHLDSQLAYAYPPGEQDYTNTMSYCHTFTVRNTSRGPVGWRLTFNTSLPPLWGADPTAKGVITSQWGFTTSGYDSGSHLWTIQGTSLASGATVNAGYCASPPTPPLDPSLYTVRISLDPASSRWWVTLHIHVTSTSVWNVPWQAAVDLADYVCPASLKGLSFSRVTGTPVVGSPTKYLIAGTSGDTQFVSSGQSRDFNFASYGPNGAPWKAGCAA